MIKAVIFDLFGVISDDVVLMAYEKLGGDPQKDADFIADILYQVNSGAIKSGARRIAERLNTTEQIWRDTVKSSSGINHELLDYIRDLRKHYKTGLLSNIGSGGLQRWFEAGYLDKYFDVAIASGDIGYAKPKAQAYQITAQKLGVKPDECIFIDDNPTLCEGARQAGMQAVLYTDFDQLKTDLQKLLTMS